MALPIQAVRSAAFGPPACSRLRHRRNPPLRCRQQDGDGNRPGSVGTAALAGPVSHRRRIRNDRLRVRGTRNLPVVDASVLPALLADNTNAPTKRWRGSLQTSSCRTLTEVQVRSQLGDAVAGQPAKRSSDAASDPLSLVSQSLKEPEHLGDSTASARSRPIRIGPPPPVGAGSGSDRAGRGDWRRLGCVACRACAILILGALWAFVRQSTPFSRSPRCSVCCCSCRGLSPRCDGRGRPDRWLVPHRRHRPGGGGRLLLHRRPQEGSDHPWWL